jgi:hypothetical protein
MLHGATYCELSDLSALRDAQVLKGLELRTVIVDYQVGYIVREHLGILRWGEDSCLLLNVIPYKC